MWGVVSGNVVEIQLERSWTPEIPKSEKCFWASKCLAAVPTLGLRALRTYKPLLIIGPHQKIYLKTFFYKILSIKKKNQLDSEKKFRFSF